MPNFQTARTNMVDCQIHTNGIIDPIILNSFNTIPRELFLPEEKQKIAYTDETISTSKDRFMLAPMVHARMVQALAIKPSEIALDIGGGNGYSAAILSTLATTVIALEARQITIDRATKILNSINFCNIVFIKGKLSQGCQEHAPYDVIFINGAVSRLPENLIQHLSTGGRLITIVQKTPRAIGEVTLVQKGQGAHYSKRVLFEACVPYVAGFEPEEEFIF
jgi:protein-L-isoaspartate(D-aspartate) O-methyltransferase